MIEIGNRVIFSCYFSGARFFNATFLNLDLLMAPIQFSLEIMKCACNRAPLLLSTKLSILPATQLLDIPHLTLHGRRALFPLPRLIQGGGAPPPIRRVASADDEGPPANGGRGAAAADGGAAAGPGARLLPRRPLHPVLLLRRPRYGRTAFRPASPNPS